MKTMWQVSLSTVAAALALTVAAQPAHAFCAVATPSVFTSVSANADGTKGPFLTTTRNPDTGAISNIFGDPLIPASPMAVAALQAVPEPGTALMWGAGLVFLVGRARRQWR